MKKFISILAIAALPMLAQAQYIAIKTDLAAIETISQVNQVSLSNHFVIHASDVDTLVTVLKRYVSLMRSNTRATFAIAEETAGNSIVRVKPTSMAYADRYELSIETRVGGNVYTIMLSDNDVKNKYNVRRINKFIKLLKP